MGGDELASIEHTPSNIPLLLKYFIETDATDGGHRYDNTHSAETDELVQMDNGVIALTPVSRN
jgi:hypothetical protein